MVKAKVNNVERKSSVGEESTKEKEDGEQEEEEEEEAESLYYKIGDAVDCREERTGAWFEAIVKFIYKKGDETFCKTFWEFDQVIPPCNVLEANVRPRARRSITVDELSVGQTVMINYNTDEPDKIGLWYDFTISEIINKTRRCTLAGRLHIGSDSAINVRTEVKETIYAIETPKLLTARTAEDEQFMISSGKKRAVDPACKECNDNPNSDCRSCGCKICAGKEEENTLLICDECDDMFHMKCLTPPLLELPQEAYWYCPECKIDENEIVKAGDKLKGTKKRPIRKTGEKERNWGGGMACVRRQQICYIVPENHCGPVPGVDVGTTWKFRIQVSEAGVHRPPVGGIHGRANDCAYSIVLSGGYAGDYDNGDEFLYSGSGGRDLSGNRRTNSQSKDQELNRMNLALARNCNAPVNYEDGAAASKDDWKKGKPVRVVRNYKLKSTYAPADGNRYDGIYKVVRYYPTKSYGFLMWKYVLRRDDPTPAPWTKKGKARIDFLGLKLLYPAGYLDSTESFSQSGGKKRGNSSNTDDSGEEDNAVAVKKFKKIKCAFDLDDELKSLIKDDKVNAKLWADCKATLIDGKPAFLNCVSERFKCVCCLGLLYNPVTTPCGHNICLKCLKQSFASELYICPTCRYNLGKTYEMTVNQTLLSALLLIYPGYKGER
ncbi:PREDICTED: E3 ubiquitin-protein ligase UHRF1-like isoform X2 [Vollenhovia emeryi]|nr:PREDICTED: E3 ubiquitin-protein ligase UHRF1-like isoform X2 [Vollenhovia emeryi]XP_011881972.1 PREDICTED: E3 ubiquitin-protein ligase UHRF1-like isoform X2 [Vollenhovia emeryi]XP_011881973.1 PREDICTED: E3 ubiquitin-protein ligase UHRF1-like isoform X2 [Vollenhovia emeryi]